MACMRSRIVWASGLLAPLLLLLLPLPAMITAQTRIEYVPARPLISPDGATIYQGYCASCHGTTGRGNGPAARLLDAPVPDLTLISMRDGTFRTLHVQAHITDVDMHEHMPDWLSILGGVNNRYFPERLLVYNLARHIESLQVRSASR